MHHVSRAKRACSRLFVPELDIVSLGESQKQSQKKNGDPEGCPPCSSMHGLSFSCSPLPRAQQPLPQKSPGNGVHCCPWACWSVADSTVGKRVGIRAQFKWNKMNVPVLRKDLSRIKVGRLAWDRVLKDSIRAALVPGRGASTIWENLIRDSSGDVVRESYALIEESLILAGVHTKKG
eukprot:1138816-Pelagomonas_calceolata.AAC.2